MRVYRVDVNFECFLYVYSSTLHAHYRAEMCDTASAESAARTDAEIAPISCALHWTGLYENTYMIVGIG